MTNVVQTTMKTTEVARALDAPVYTLHFLLREGRIRRPAKDASGDYCWSPADVEAARAALPKHRARSRVLASDPR